mmetsp:Transcript_11824/g.15452  ORF Transcript_11824/g.15452 Transcript_11824/m.15452 type:complete len:210 (+) Transcript_11824:40-669(+)
MIDSLRVEGNFLKIHLVLQIPVTTHSVFSLPMGCDASTLQSQISENQPKKPVLFASYKRELRSCFAVFDLEQTGFIDGSQINSALLLFFQRTEILTHGEAENFVRNLSADPKDDFEYDSFIQCVIEMIDGGKKAHYRNESEETYAVHLQEFYQTHAQQRGRRGSGVMERRAGVQLHKRASGQHLRRARSVHPKNVSSLRLKERNDRAHP